MQPPAELEIARELPPAGSPLELAERYTRWLARHHYENFTVVSRLLPRRLHQDFYNLYAYCRWADDLGDEIADSARALQLLDWWQEELRRCFAGSPSHAVFVALRRTVTERDLPIEPFLDLLSAFRQDQTVHRYPDWPAVLDYCRYSANPVGRLVLCLCGHRDAERQRLSDATCTALQLANFWQDVARDLDKGRIYIPLDALAAHGLTEVHLFARRFDPRYAALMKDVVARTRKLFDEGMPLARMVSPELRVDLELFSRGGLAVLDAIEAIGYNTLERRPALSRKTQMRLLGRAWVAHLFAAQEPAPAPVPVSPGRSESSPHLDASYAHCRGIARAAARNFFYAIGILPEAKRDALCALYAFMRRADDIADSAGKVAEKQRHLAAWRAALDRALLRDYVEGDVLPALHHALSRYNVPPRYLHDLVSGMEMDLSVTSYATFDRLREYCYRVAGTVGLSCLHVFGFDDPRAPEMAEKLGIAFQLTNILRDVAQDLQMGRVYLPQEDLDRFACAADLASRNLTPAFVELMRFQADRAWAFYTEGAQLLPLVAEDSRPALWALARIYSGILAKIEARGYDVFSPPRVGLSHAEKTWIMFRARLGWTPLDALEQRNRDRRRAGGTLLRRRAG